ncbi:DNA polymerase III subunit chi [Altererythrobacter sp. KTW20L]|uniref:DNA polymerase III subunit chi n=1 Tax=Altererythrobacter sp. KTW20L TaxID=2942210 RepID=UPI0020BD7F40|nr:DNA polymerase III subunit chi [Altererythrobacter sp. KTW20L]MCL6250722.1 DNA polymerase III subunit chi [Altererythrobacter sp. KTW20L]
MRLGFYLHADQLIERVLPLIARAAMGQGQRLLVVSADVEQVARLDAALWEAFPDEFLAHGFSGGPHDARQPILLSDRCEAANGATLVALADGLWREEAESFERALLFFDEEGRSAARATWRLFDGREDVSREFHELENGRWIQKA